MHPFQAAVEEFDAAYHKVRAHLLHTIGTDEQQLAHDTATAAKPPVAEASKPNTPAA
jgi:hypothetical protein